jgi:Arc/MetJ-type ribon-helix-helix transcriptional regulator
MTKLDHVSLPDEAARFAAAQVEAGRFRSIDDVLAAGVEALRERDEFQDEWLSDARQRFTEGRKVFARGDVVHVTPDELMDGIEINLFQQGATHEA